MVRALAIACERILVEEGPDGLNTNRIAEVAGVPIGSLYRYFPNKEALVAEVYEQKLEALAAAYEAGWARSEEHVPATLEEALALHVEGNAAMHLRLLRIHEAFYREHQASLDLGERTSERYDRSFLAQAEAWLESQLRRFEGELGVDDLALATFIVTRSVAGALRSAARDAPERLSEPAFREALIRMALAFLRAKRE
jgi:AcrR family transcriptional regulator